MSKTISVHNMFLEFSQVKLTWNEQSAVILWVSWCKNKSFWQRFTCTYLLNICVERTLKDFSVDFFPFQELLSAERRTHLLFLSILKEVNWFPVRFSTVINGSLFFSVQGPRCQKYLTISFFSKYFPAVFMSNFCRQFRFNFHEFSEFQNFCRVLIFQSRRQSQKNQVILEH